MTPLPSREGSFLPTDETSESKRLQGGSDDPHYHALKEKRRRPKTKRRRPNRPEAKTKRLKPEFSMAPILFFGRFNFL